MPINLVSGSCLNKLCKIKCSYIIASPPAPTGFDLGVNKQLMIEVSGLCLGPPRLPVMPCPHANSLSIAQKYHSIFLNTDLSTMDC